MSQDGRSKQRRGTYESLMGQGGPGRKRFTNQQYIKDMLTRKLLEISMNRFEWKGLPDEVDIRWMELALNCFALSVFHYDDTYSSYFAMRGTPSGFINMVGNPVEYLVYGNNYYQKQLNAKDCVPIWANYMRMPDLDIIDIYADRIAKLDRTIEINSIAMRRGKVLIANENTRASIDVLNDQIDSGAATVKVLNGLSIDGAIEAIDLGVDPDTVVNVHILRTREWSECMTLLGINNSNQDKKERLTAAETSGNDDVIATIRATNLKARQQAAELINKKYSLNVSVDYTTDMNTAELKDVSGTGDSKKVGA